MIHDVPTVEHSPLGASGAPRWINCPGSVKASEGREEQESVFAAEGSAAHHIADWCFNDGKKAAEFIGEVFQVGKHKFGVTDDFAAHIQEFLDWCAEVPADISVSEAKIPYERWVPGGFCWVDRMMIKDGVCTIRDLKFGKGVQVWAAENEQLLVQAIGVLETYWYEDIHTFQLGIHQPRLDHKDEWLVSKEAVIRWAIDTLSPALKEIKKGEKFVPGEWCQFCRFKRDCAVRANVGLQNIFGSLDEVAGTTPVSIEMSPERKTQILPLVPVMKSWLKDFERGVLADLIAGKPLGGWKLVEGRSNRAFSDKDAVVKRISPDDAFEKKLRSPSQLEKLMGKPRFSKILGDLVTKPPGKPKLAPPDDPRPAIENLSQSIFDSLDDTEE